MADENALTKLPLAAQLGISAVVAVVIGVGFYYGYWQSAQQKKTEQTAKLEELRKEIQKLEVTASKLQEFTRDVAQLEAQLEKLKLILPSAKETPNLMRRVQALASEARLSITNFTPGKKVRKEFSKPPAKKAAARGRQRGKKAAPQPQDYYEEHPINVSVTGTYHNLGQFFDTVGRLKRLVNLGNISIKASSKQTVSETIAVNAVATTYVYVEASRPATAGGPAR